MSSYSTRNCISFRSCKWIDLPTGGDPWHPAPRRSPNNLRTTARRCRACQEQAPRIGVFFADCMDALPRPLSANQTHNRRVPSDHQARNNMPSCCPPGRRIPHSARRLASKELAFLVVVVRHLFAETSWACDHPYPLDRKPLSPGTGPPSVSQECFVFAPVSPNTSPSRTACRVPTWCRFSGPKERVIAQSDAIMPLLVPAGDPNSRSPPLEAARIPSSTPPPKSTVNGFGDSSCGTASDAGRHRQGVWPPA